MIEARSFEEALFIANHDVYLDLGTLEFKDDKSTRIICMQMEKQEGNPRVFDAKETRRLSLRQRK